MGKTFAEKLLAKHAGLDEVVPGQIVTVKPAHLLTHDNTAAIIGKIGDELNTYGVVNPELSVIVLDHVVPASNEKTATNHKKIREFVLKHGIKNFYDAFLTSLQHHGRVFEMGILMGYNFKSGHLLADADLGPKILGKGKIHFLPTKIKGKDQVARIFEKFQKKKKVRG